MEANIDLIPAEERIKRSKEKAKKLVLVVSLILFVLTLGASGYVYYKIKQLDQQTAEIIAQVETKKAKIEEKAGIEIAARNLDSKYKVLSQILADRLYYSKLLDELVLRTPENITITSIDSSVQDTASLAGVALDYISLAKFLNSLADPKVASASASAENLFKEVVINTVTLDPLDASARFNLSVTLDAELLKKK